MPYGSIIRLVPEHGFGFLRDDSSHDWFFLASGVRGGGLADVWVDERVGFQSELTANGPRAIDIHSEQLD